MNTFTLNTHKTKAEKIQFVVLIAFTLFSLYFSVSMYRLSHLKTQDLTSVTDKVENIVFQRSKGKQARPEVWVELGSSGKFRLNQGNPDMLRSLSDEIKKGDVVTLYHNEGRSGFIDLSKDNDVLQLSKGGKVLYSLNIAQKNFYENFLLSSIMCFVMPLGFMFYWAKAKSNLMMEALRATSLQKNYVSAE